MLDDQFDYDYEEDRDPYGFPEEYDGECAQCGRFTSLVGGICDACSLKNTLRQRDQRTVREMR